MNADTVSFDASGFFWLVVLAIMAVLAVAVWMIRRQRAVRWAREERARVAREHEGPIDLSKITSASISAEKIAKTQTPPAPKS